MHLHYKSSLLECLSGARSINHGGVPGGVALAVAWNSPSSGRNADVFCPLFLSSHPANDASSPAGCKLHLTWVLLAHRSLGCSGQTSVSVSATLPRHCISDIPGVSDYVKGDVGRTTKGFLCGRALNSLGNCILINSLGCLFVCLEANLCKT